MLSRKGIFGLLLVVLAGLFTAPVASATLRPPPLYAVVDAGGNLVRQPSTVTSTRLGPGRYEVTFNQDVRRCVYTATIGDLANGLVYYPGLVFTAGGHLGDNGVYVETKNLGGGLADYPFHLYVGC